MPKHQNTHPLDGGYLQIDNNDLQISELMGNLCPDTVFAEYDGRKYANHEYAYKTRCKVNSWLVHTDRDTYETVKKARAFLARTMPANCRYEVCGSIVDELRSIVARQKGRGFAAPSDWARACQIYIYMASALANIALYMGHNPIDGDMMLSCGRLNVVVRF